MTGMLKYGNKYFKHTNVQKYKLAVLVILDIILLVW